MAGSAEYRATYIEKAKENVYEVTSGADGIWTESSTNPLVFVFKRTVNDETTIEHFTGIDVDAKAVPEKDSSGRANYTVEQGSAIVSLQPAFLATLTDGNHTLKAFFDDGNDVEVPFKTVAKEDPSTDPTDDDKKGGKDSGADEGSSGTSGKGALPKTGDAPSGTVVCLVIAAAYAFLLAALLRDQRNHRA